MEETKQLTDKLKLKNIKDCTGCRAFDGSHEHCALGFSKDHYTPLEPCYKPRTYNELLMASKTISNQPQKA